MTDNQHTEQRIHRSLFTRRTPEPRERPLISSEGVRKPVAWMRELFEVSSVSGFARMILAIILVSLTTTAFAWWQNQSGWVGGPISLAKTLWLNFALLTFFVVPFCLWRNRVLTGPVRALFGWVLLSFAVRGIVELLVLYFTRRWECIYGISHDLFTLALAIWLRWRLPPERSEQDRRALGFLTLFQATLLLEMLMAWLFSRLASPADGIYFAADSEHFRTVNDLSWGAVAILYPALAYFVWHTRHDFLRT